MTKSWQGKLLLIITILWFSVNLPCCATTAPPQNVNNLCAIFKERSEWYKAAKKSEKRWGTPIQVMMAIMYQESRFVGEAKPPRRHILGFIPWGRISSAYGYAQAQDLAWDQYKREAGSRWADRDDFSDAIDFIGWYTQKTHKINGISKWQTDLQYLNYHEGWTGYRRKTHKKKSWLLKVAKNVERRASEYGAQLRKCREELDKGWLERLFH